MSDLIERLRRIESNQVSDFFATNWQRNPDGPEAADEIERLRRELAEAQKALRSIGWSPDAQGKWAARDTATTDQPELAVELQAKGYQPKPVGSK